MKIEVLDDPDAVAGRAATLVAEHARAAVKERGRFTFAVSGGHTPWVMLRALAGEQVPWNEVHVVQVDERVAPADSDERNFKHLRESLLSHVPLPPANLHAMPVEVDDLAAAAAQYAQTLESLAGSPPHAPPKLDLVHLGLGPDGHTASLVPGDAVLEVTDAWVALTTGLYQGRRRMTLTYPVLDGARSVLWLVAGAEKVDALRRLRRHDRTIPAGRVRQDGAVVVADRAAAAGSEGN
jgi:6-phosphogluconolactonase